MTGRTGSVLRGRTGVPGDKSISHRAAIIGAIATGSSRVRGLNDGLDVRATVEALRGLGAGVTVTAAPEPELVVEGYGWAGLREPSDVIDARNSGTTMRLMLGVVAGLYGAFVVTGDRSLRRRPMLRVVHPLRQLGARIDGRSHADLAPLFVRGTDLTGADLEIPVASAQVKSAVLFAGMRASGTTSVMEPEQSRDHTERMLAAAGVAVEIDGTRVAIDGGTDPNPLDLTVPGDPSAAAFLLTGAAIIPGSEVTVTGAALNATRTRYLEVLRAMGASIAIDPTGDEAGEPVGEVTVGASELAAVPIGPPGIADLIDEIPILAVAATQADGETLIRGAAELRVKESDRIRTLVEGLNRLGATVEELPDGLAIRGPTRLRGAEVDSAGDHRIAMAFAIAGLLTDDRVRVLGWRSVETSFPGFLDVLASVQERQ